MLRTTGIIFFGNFDFRGEGRVEHGPGFIPGRAGPGWAGPGRALISENQPGFIGLDFDFLFEYFLPIQKWANDGCRKTRMEKRLQKTEKVA